jgi:hypothetical protein
VPLGEWLEEIAGLSGKKLSNALALCEAKDIEAVSDLWQLHDKGRLDRLGFQEITLSIIEDALAGVPAAARRRMQEPAAGSSSCAAIQDSIAALWAQLGTMSAVAADFPVGAIIDWHDNATLPSDWFVCDGTHGTPDMRSKFVIGAGTRTVPLNRAAFGAETRQQRIPVTYAAADPLQIAIPPGDWVAAE